MSGELTTTKKEPEEQILDDLYERLGVPSTATQAQIKQAYRQLAAFYHPDNLETGNRRMFDAIKEAYDVLMDENKRLQYDLTGNIEKPSIDDPIEVEAREQCAVILSNIISEEANPDQVNVLEKMDRVFANMFRQLDERRHQLADRERRTKSLRKRLKRKKGMGNKRGSLLIVMLEHHIKQVSEGKKKLEHDTKVVTRAQEIFNEYNYEVDEPEMTFDQFRSRMRSPHEPMFFHMGRNFRGPDSTGS